MAKNKERIIDEHIYRMLLVFENGMKPDEVEKLDLSKKDLGWVRFYVKEQAEKLNGLPIIKIIQSLNLKKLWRKIRNKS